MFSTLDAARRRGSAKRGSCNRDLRSPAVAGLAGLAVMVATADPELLDQVLSVTAAVGVEPLVVSDPGLLHPQWASASMLLLGVDQAARVAALGLPRSATSS